MAATGRLVKPKGRCSIGFLGKYRKIRYLEMLRPYGGGNTVDLAFHRKLSLLACVYSRNGHLFQGYRTMQFYVVLNSGVIVWLAASFLVTASGLAYIVAYLNESDD
jgi:hypothetical protein